MVDLTLPDFQSDERGVSPVIGVILMVAITVILAAVIGAFVLDLGSQLGSTGPQTNIAVSDGSGSSPMGDSATSQTPALEVVEMEHKGGDDLKAGEWKVQVTTPSGITKTLSDGTWTGLNVQTGDSTDDVEIQLTKNPSTTEFVVGETVGLSMREAGTGGLSGSYDFSGEWTVKVIHGPSNSVVTSTKVEVN